MKKNGKYVFAGSSYSELAFENVNSEVIEYDRDEWSRLNFCGANTGSFLIAMLTIFEMRSLRYQKLVDIDDEVANERFLDRCVLASGAVKYKRFYKEIIF